MTEKERPRPDPALVAFGAVVRRTRNDWGMNQRQFAARAAMHQTTVSRIERGLMRTITLERLVPIFALMGLINGPFHGADRTTRSNSVSAAVPPVTDSD